MQTTPLYVFRIRDRTFMSGPLGPVESEFFAEMVLPALVPMGDRAYLDLAPVILGSLARWSYVLDGQRLYWCVEWRPGLLVIRHDADGAFAAATFTSPNPQFGGRVATADELDRYDEHAPDPQYSIVFDAWDAQFDEVKYRDKRFVAASPDVVARFWDALRHANSLIKPTAEG